MAKTYFIIPAYNESKVIKEVLEEVLTKYPNVVCVNDGSSDNTADEIAKTNAILVSHSINLGQGAALQTGIEFALQDLEASVFVTFDADGQHRLSDVERMINVLQDSKVDIVLGSRFLEEKIENIKTSKRILLKAAVIFTNKSTGLQLTDAHNGLRVFNRTFAEKLKLTFSDMTHASELVDRIKQYDFKYQEVPVKIQYTEYSLSKGQSAINAINIAIDSSLNKVIKK
jgi:glycosyltransferase involved in cell wall biosynthesis